MFASLYILDYLTTLRLLVLGYVHNVRQDIGDDYTCIVMEVSGIIVANYLGHYPVICLEGVRKTTKCSQQKYSTRGTR
jgi:hypothetical protein